MSVSQLLQRKQPPPVIRIDFPSGGSIRAQYWSVPQAARAWGLPYRFTQRWIMANLEFAVILAVCKSGKTRHILAVSAGLTPPIHPGKRRGNPQWRDSAKQRELVCRRWN